MLMTGMGERGSSVQTFRRVMMKRRGQRLQIRRRRETWWWHYLPLHRETVGGHLGPPALAIPAKAKEDKA